MESRRNRSSIGIGECHDLDDDVIRIVQSRVRPRHQYEGHDPNFNSVLHRLERHGNRERIGDGILGLELSESGPHLRIW
jgi:hypothetical protein